MSIDSEPEIIFKWTNLCRLCLSSESHIDLFSSDVDSQECLSKIRSCLNLLVYYGDPMPTKLCSQCHLKLDEWCQFRKQCIQSENNVKKRLQPYKDIQFVKEYFERCAKFESSEIVSSSSKTNPNSVQSFEEANSSDHAQEYLEEENFKRLPKPPHFNDRGGKPEKNKKLSKNSHKAITSNNLASCDVDLSDKTSNSEGIFDDDSDVSARQEQLDAIGGKNENSALGTIVSVTGSASDLWDTHYHSKQSEEEDYFYGDNYNKADGRINGQDKSCPHCGVDLSAEEFDLHTCCVIGSSTHLEEDGDGEEVFGEDEEVDEEEGEGDEDDEDEDGDDIEDENGHFEDTISLESDGTESFLTEDQLPGDEAVRSTVRSKITPWKCKACNLYFPSCFELRKHYSSLKCLGKKVKAIDCEFCYRQFLTLNDLLEHQVVHIRINLDLTDDDLICCNQCLLQFPDQKRLTNHLLVHTLKRKLPPKYTCSSCSEVFTQKDSYETHLLTHAQMQSPTESSMEAEPEGEPEPEPEPEMTPSDEPMITDAMASTEGTSSEEPKKTQGAVRCFRCGLMFGSVKQLEHHEAIRHKNPTPYICRKCCLRFSARSQLLMHLRVHMSKSNNQSETNEHSCTVCDAKFLLESDLDSHMKTHRNPTSEPPSPTTSTQTPLEEDESNSDMFAKYKCSLCSRLYVRAASCIRHGQQSHKGQKVIPLRLKRSVFLGRRTSLAPGGKVKHKCPKCPKYFFSFNAFSMHAYRNHGMKLKNRSEESNSLETEEVPESSSSKPDEMESKCPFCSKDIKPSYISLHIKKFHRGEVIDPTLIDKDIPADSCICRYCLKTCSTPHNRRLHESIHYPVKAQRNQCETCGQKFTEKPDYEEHARTCKSIRCGKCHKIFFKFVNLTQHCCTGTRNDEAHKCTVCLSAFTSLDLLQIHIKNFHGKKSELANNQPGTSKNTGKRLERELWREESNKIVCMVGEKFYCTYCDCEFSTTQESNDHRAVHPRGNWYAVQISDSLFQCTICDKFFETRKSSLLHINYHKKNLLPEPAKPMTLSLEPEVEIFTDVTPKAKKFNCRFCSAAFRDEEDLQEHLFHTHVKQT